MAVWTIPLLLLLLSQAMRAFSQYENVNQFGLPAMLIFGDSTVDVGNNNVYKTIMHSDHPPYGRDFGYPSGRFSNGMLAPDFIAQRLNLPFAYAYTSPNATGSNLLFGANFAAAASGFVDSTASLFNVASFTQQLQWFSEYRSRLAQLVGPQHAAYILSKALFVISSGSNDYIYYRLNRQISQQYNNDQFKNLLISKTYTFMKDLYNAGARRIAVISLGPLGCLPSEITTAGMAQRKCVEELNQKAVNHNADLQRMLDASRASLPGAAIAYLDSYSVLFDAIHNPAKYGFEVVDRGCCGSGLIEVGDLCNSLSVGTCRDSSKFIFWDSFHPTQNMYKVIADVFYQQAAAQLA